MNTKENVIASDASWIESEALAQLKYVSGLPGMIETRGMPDIHPGKGGPVGAAFLSKEYIYPFLIGGDIGCGMRLSMLDKKARKMKIEQWEKRLKSREPISFDGELECQQAGVEPAGHEESLGTLGSGNHFAEIMVVEKVHDDESFQEAGLDAGKIFLLVHTGSRGYGQEILRAHVDRFTNEGLAQGGEAFDEYLQAHDNALAWASLNRSLVARKLLRKLKIGPSDDEFFEEEHRGEKTVLDVPHNFVERVEKERDVHWLHRKGAAPSDRGLVIIPGTRGSLSYLVKPLPRDESLCSIAHGAGRKWNRIRTRQMARARYERKELIRSTIGSRLITNDKAVIFEEAPDGYKKIETVISDLELFGLVEVVAAFRPVITYKVDR